MTKSDQTRVIKGRFYQFEKLAPNPLVNFFQNERLRRIIRMMDFEMGEKSIILDLGCNRGYFSRDLSLITQTTTIGVEVDKRSIIIAKQSVPHVDFVCADICSLPFRKDSIDRVVCVSVFEHIEDLSGAMKQIKSILRRDGMLITGYPVEGKTLRVMFRLLWSRSHPEEYLLPSDPNKSENEKRSKSPRTHKRDFHSIRDIISKYFLIIRKEKLSALGFTSAYLPDFVSIYEWVKTIKK